MRESRRFRFLLAALVALAVASVASAQSRDERIAEAVRQLGNNSYQVREAATARLWAFGPDAIKALEKAAVSDDPEVRVRARAVLEKLRYGILPNSPPDLVKLAERYRRGNQAQRRDVLGALLKKDMRAFDMVRALYLTEQDIALRVLLAKWLGEKIPKSARAKLAEGKRDEALELLRNGLTTGNREVLCHYAAWRLLTGSLPAARKAAQAEAEKGGDRDTYALLARLAFAAGDMKAARLAAEEAQDTTLQRRVLIEQRDWEALARTIEDARPDSGPTAAGLLAFYKRLAGDAEGLHAAVGILKDMARKRHKSRYQVMRCANALLIAQRPADAVEVCLMGDRYREAFGVRVAQGKRKEALALLEPMISQKVHDRLFAVQAYLMLGRKDKALPIMERLTVELRSKQSKSGSRVALARLYRRVGNPERWNELIEEAWHKAGDEGDLGVVARSWAADSALELGDKEKCVELLRRIHAELKKPPDTPVRLIMFVRLACRTGLREIALQRVAESLRSPKMSKPIARDFCNSLWPKRILAAPAWWSALRLARPAESPEDFLKRLGHVLDAKRSPGEIGKTVADTEVAVAKLPEDKRQTAVEALAEACETVGAVKAGRRLLKRALKAKPSRGLLMREGRRRIRAGQWRAAAETYARVAKASPGDAPVLYLQGYALGKAGEAGKGKRLRELGALLPLADRVERRRLAVELVRAGLVDEALGQWDVSLRVAPGGWSNDTVEDVAYIHIDRGRFDKLRVYPTDDALRALRRARSYYSVKFSLTIGQRPALMAALRDLQKGERRKEAVATLRRLLRDCPVNSDVPQYACVVLDKLGMRKEADELFETAYRALLDEAKRDPFEGWRLNEIAWTCALAERKLKEGLEQARKAVRLRPLSAAYMDTLAEVLHRLGRHEEAAKWERAALKAGSPSAIHVVNLLRYEAAARKAKAKAGP